MRTREQIIADCEKRFNEMRKGKETRESDPRFTHTCDNCRFCSGSSDFLWEARYCGEPLVRGFEPPHVLRHELYKPRTGWRDDQGRHWDFPHLCGPEKALWQPKLTLWQRFINFLTGDAA